MIRTRKRDVAMAVTIDLDRLRVHLTPERATLVAHADGVPYRVEEYPLPVFIALLRQREEG